MIFHKKVFLPILFAMVMLSVAVVVVVRMNSSRKDKNNDVLTDRAKNISRTDTDASTLDSDGDSLKDWEEMLRGTNPQNPDSDGDGTFDGDEIMNGRNPLVAGPNDVVKEKTAAIKQNNELQGGVFTKVGGVNGVTTPNPTLPQTVSPDETTTILIPKIFAVSPNRVRKGETVTVTGTNFTPTNNTIFLKDGPAQRRFDGLPSYDGQTLTFVYNPPDIKIMTEAEIRALPENIVAQIEAPLKTAGMTISDALKSYSELGIKNESELRSLLESGGRAFEDVYHYFWVAVENEHGSDMPDAPLLHGLPKAVSDLAAGGYPLFSFSTIGKNMRSLLRKITPVAYAQTSQKGGGFFVTVLICTCNFDGWMDFMSDYSGGGSGLWKFTWGTVSDAGFAFGAGYWLGGYQQAGATCSVGVRPYCADIQGSTRKRPFGTSM